MYLYLVGETCSILSFSKGISATWNAYSFVQDLNSDCRIHFQRPQPLYNELHSSVSSYLSRLLFSVYTSICLCVFIYLCVFLSINLYIRQLTYIWIERYSWISISVYSYPRPSFCLSQKNFLKTIYPSIFHTLFIPIDSCPFLSVIYTFSELKDVVFFLLFFLLFVDLLLRLFWFTLHFSRH